MQNEQEFCCPKKRAAHQDAGLELRLYFACNSHLKVTPVTAADCRENLLPQNARGSPERQTRASPPSFV